MPTTPFSTLLRERMAHNGLTDRKVSAALATAGVTVTAGAVGAWRRGVCCPKDGIRSAVAAVIGADVVTVTLACAGRSLTPLAHTKEW